MNTKFIKDYEKFTPNEYKWFECIIRLLRNHELRYCFWGRINESTRGKLLKQISFHKLRVYRKKYGLEMNFNNIGGGIRLIHPWMITVNHNAKLGENVTLYGGGTIGEILSGEKKGNPIIEDNVVVYANATICGNVKISENSIIAAGSFVNFDVPPNSLVIGNPGVIHANNSKV